MMRNISRYIKISVFILVIMLIFSFGATLTEVLSDKSLPAQNKRNHSPFLTDLKAVDLPENLIPQSVSKTVPLPFSGFIQNRGQLADESLDYYYSTGSLSVGFAASEIKFRVSSSPISIPICFSLTFPGAQHVAPVGRHQQPHYVNYLYTDFQLANVPTYDEVWYHDLYPGIDLRYYMSADGLKYDFLVHPGADPTPITLQVSSSMVLTIEPQNISFQTHHHASICFQDTHLRVFQGDGTAIAAHFVPKNTNHKRYGFHLASFDSSQFLIIDPLAISFSTFLGTGETDQGQTIAVDAYNNTYITGMTWSSNFPMKNAYNSTHGGIFDCYVAKLNATGNGLVFSTFLGGNEGDWGHGIAVDAYNNTYITGFTGSSNFPTFNAYNSTYGGGDDAFVTKLNATGNGLVFSTFLGGNSVDWGWAIVVDVNNNMYIAGETESSNFPTKNAYASAHSGNRDVFITKINATGTGLVFSTFLGGNSLDQGKVIALDAYNNTYISGATWSSNFPTKNAYDNTYTGGRDAFVTKLNATGNGLVFSTFLGGSSEDVGDGIAVDAYNNTYIGGATQSVDFPMKNAYNATNGGNWDAFITKINATGTGLMFSTFLGSTSYDWGSDITVDAYNNTYITGATQSSNFPTKNAYDNTYNGGEDAFVTKLNATGNGLIFSTFLGGSSDEWGNGITVDTYNNTYIIGLTSSSNFPTFKAYDSTHNGVRDVFVVKTTIDDTNPAIILESPLNDTVQISGTTIDVAVTDANLDIVLYNWDGAANQTWSGMYQTPLPTGDTQHVLYVYANDSAGNWAAFVFVFTTDDTVPTITLETPLNDTVHNSGTIIDVDLSDLHLVTVLFNWDGAANQTWSGMYQTSLPTGDGLHWLYVYANDSAGNWATVVFVFTTDDTVPTIMLETPLNDTVQISGTTIDVAVIDANLD
ncbi:MAG: SBBP repeat-containing protein, partial [Candidatus Hermodarchaeota archaeon]